MEHYISYKEIENKTITQLVDLIGRKEKKLIRDLKITDLIINNQSLTGVYIFFADDNKAVYVGKTGSRAILERIAGHFDLREGAYMNTFLCALTGKKKGRNTPQATTLEIMQVYETALSHKFVFIEVTDDKPLINRLENILRIEFEPNLNSPRGAKMYDRETKIKDLM